MKPVKNLFGLLAALTLLWSCTREHLSSDPGLLLRATEDSLAFDTVFTSTGSVSQVVKLINDHTQDINVSAIELIGGSGSPFKINVNGIAGPVVQNTRIPAKDSVYIFVTLKVTPNAQPLPFVVTDSIVYEYNGNKGKIGLSGYGRNAHFLKDHLVTGNEEWNNDLPYVVLGKLTIDTTAKLTINKGCKVYVHADAPIIINGTLEVNGEAPDSNRVTFTGDRLDDPYRNFPASYPGIIFTESSTGNRFTYAKISNAYQALVVTGQPQANKLELNETIIDNAYESGITAINSSINARNVLVSNCGKNIVIVDGGNYFFTHVTAAAYSNSYISHKFPILTISNSANINGSVSTQPLLADFTNCIFWAEDNGFVDDEVVVNRQGTTSFSVSFDHVLWRVKSDPSPAIITSAINKTDPEFAEIDNFKRSYNFRLKDTSPARNAGKDAGVSLDLDGLSRPVGQPDLGAFEKH